MDLRGGLSRGVALAAGVLLLAGCDDGLERQSQVTRVRVLAVRSTPAAEWAFSEQGQAEPLRFEALAVAPDARPLTVTFALCLPGNVYSPDFQCPGKDGVTLPEGRLSPDDPAVRPLLDAMRESSAAVPFFVGYEVSDGSGTPEGQERGLRRVEARLTDTPNQNPKLLDVLFQGEPLAGPLPTGTSVELAPLLAPGSQETYEGADGPVTESISFAWHATGSGEVEFFRSVQPGDDQPSKNTTKYTTPTEPGPVTLYVVARDGRGGTDWLIRTVDVR